MMLFKKLIRKIVQSGCINFLLRWLGEYLYNSMIHDLSKISYIKSPPPPPPITKSLNRKWGLINKVLRYYDPVITVSEEKIKLKIRLSFKNIYYYALFPLYDRALPRICKLIKDIDNELFLVDVGANIGDTALLVSKNVSGGSILCIEGNEQIFSFLKQNTAQIKNNTVFYDFRFCTDNLENNQFIVEMKDGTAHLSSSLQQKVSASPLDNMVMDNPLFKKTNILKIDTDGFEITVLNGAKKLLAERHPVLYFEFTPDAYIENGQNPMTLIDLLVSYGYTKALFYTNFGVPVDIFDLNNQTEIQEVIHRIDNNTIFYYDILAIHDKDFDKYSSIYTSELQWKNL